VSQAHRSNRSTRYRGYVLVLTLVLTAIAALSLLGASRASLRCASAALSEQREVQRRWGALSIEHTLIPRAEAVLAAEEKRQHLPVIRCKKTLQLGGARFDVLLCDEQAKLNVASQFAERGREDTERVIRRVLAETTASIHVQLHPATAPGLAAIASYDQVFDQFDPLEAVPADASDRRATDLLTCWSDGRLNVRRADEQALRIALQPALDDSGVQRLLALRQRQEPSATLGEMLDALELTRERRAAVEKRLMDGSACHAVWTVISNGEVSCYRLVVRQSRPAATFQFEW